MIRTKETPAKGRSKAARAGRGPGRPKGAGKRKGPGRPRKEAPGHNSPLARADAFIRRLENLEADRAEAVAELRVQYAADAKAVLNEAKAAGLLPKMLKAELAIRKLARRGRAIANGLEVGERDQLQGLYAITPSQIEIDFGPAPKAAKPSKSKTNGAGAEPSPFQRGFEAAVAGASIDDNPFNAGKQADEWLDGHAKATDGAKLPKPPKPAIQAASE